MPDLPWSQLVQPDQQSCGAAVLVVARMLGDPGYATFVDTSAGLPQRFRDEVLAMHRRVTGLADVSGRAQLPWPQAFGTPPWAVANQLSGTRAADGTVTTYGWHLARSARDPSYARLLACARTGRVAAIYIGSTWLPRHVVLVVGLTSGGDLDVYDPAHGRVGGLSRTAYDGNHVGIAGWDVVWFDITPEGSP